ncbi:glycoside hydrolase family 9 protein [Cryptosporangium aurantiacum]|uniref:N-terminal ig-like domain of cellulase n=1 Tax=Cryptosporangium aurantiacum TaxID=134849 RepID=A0A1M7RFT9_9ACTN|nr:glycoside hydrolase family 9 protein [Cryptosporangium aurantiacum]SHN45029.1 N-terminal ig-like domain of cellulase [Cryptosporangium aurantiacum]
MQVDPPTWLVLIGPTSGSHRYLSGRELVRNRLPRLLTTASAVLTTLALVAGCTGESDEKPERPSQDGSWSPVGPTDAVVHTDQVGYGTLETKVAVLLAPRKADSAGFVVERQDGSVALKGTVGTDRGAWSERYPATYPIDVSGLRTAGAYRIRVTGGITAVSPVFVVGASRELFGQVAADTVEFFGVQRDGADVLSKPIPREPSHLNDAKATVYDAPDFADGDDLGKNLTATAGAPAVDVTGGWFDAGDYLKFTHTTAYALALMLLAERGGATSIGNGKAIDGIGAEAAFGVDWLDKMWDESTQTLYLQVGLGSGGADGLLGDHDVWRLPQDDDSASGESKRYLSHRPVFRANQPGEEISPNVAGRVAAAFALAAQVEAGDDPTAARAHLDAAATILDLAGGEDYGTLMTSYPREYYPESSWADDMALGATELARAGLVLGDTRATTWTQQAARFASLSISAGNKGPLNLYDVGPLVDAELHALLQETGNPATEVTPETLVGNLKARLDTAVAAAAKSPIGAAAPITQDDFTSKTFGWAAVAALYHRAADDDSYDAFGTTQRNVALGTNGWGLSLVVGVGHTYAKCIHHQIANLAGSLTGTGKIATGAVVNGPNASSAFKGLTTSDTAKTCTGVNVSRFDRSDAKFVDQPQAYSSVEPAIDFTATALLAVTLQARL